MTTSAMNKSAPLKGFKKICKNLLFKVFEQVEYGTITIQDSEGEHTFSGKSKPDELHAFLQQGFGVDTIHSEYGMTELLSQGYSRGNGIFQTPPWMKILTRDTEDALTIQKIGKTGGINIIDLANYNSCAFIATQDLGKVHQNGTFEIIGRFDNSDIRGCNLMVL